jgi:CRP-like cAMP-binding protein
MSSLHSHDQNHLLALLPAVELERFSAHLELVALPLGEMLYEPGGQLQHAYFPTTGVVSLHYVLESGATAESAGVGNEGVVGIALFMGGGTTSSSAVVQTAGHAYRLAGRLLKQEFDRAGLMQQLLLRYTQSLMTQMSQTAVCNRHHSVEQQLCRWLLLTLDRAPSRELVMTQELVASMLGVRREGITGAAGNLQRAGVIRYRRGHITVLERAGLEARVCECYAVVSRESTRLLAEARCGAGAAQPKTPGSALA